MSDKVSINDILQRVERMLDALNSVDQSLQDFQAGCDQLGHYLNDKKASLMVSCVQSEPYKSRIAVIIERLGRLQKRAEIRANIPAGMQKYIAEQLD